ncbi:hypothetical protein ABH930_001720 [Kitasatospora sp. GAS204A]|nr:hypothetical protein [Kitasatospora sp. GAS204B]
MTSRRHHFGAPTRLLTTAAVVALTAALAGPIAHAAGPSGLPSQAAIDAATALRSQERPPANDTDKAIAQAEATKQNVPIDALTTEFSETVATPTGHLSLTSHPDQQRVKRNGTWQALDADLAANPDGSYSPKASVANLVLSKGGDGPLATMTSTDGKKLALTAPFALPAPTVSGDSVLYPSVAPDIDLKVTATKLGGLTTVLVVKTQAAAANPVLKDLHFDTVADGVTVSSDQVGDITATAADGNPRFLAPTPQMWDSSTTPAAPAANGMQLRAALQTTAAGGDGTAAPTSTTDGPGAASKVATMPVKADGTGIDLTPDQDLLAHGTAPYYIDPAWVPWSPSANSWTWVQSAYPNLSNWMRSGSGDSDHPGVGICGYYAAGNSCSPVDKYRSFYQFDISGLNGAIVSSATMNMQEYSSADWTCADTYPLDLYLTGAIYPPGSGPNGTGTNWTNQPGQVGGSLGEDKVGGSGCGPNIPFQYNITGTMQQYANNGQLTFGLYGNESNDNAFKRFTYQPSISIQYDRVPNTPTNPAVWPAPKTMSTGTTNQSCGDGNSNDWAWLGAGSNQNGAVWLNATVSSPTQGQLWSWDHLWDYQLSGVPDVASGYSNLAASGGTTSFGVPGSVIQDGHSYGYGIMASDQLPGVSWSASTPTCYFKVDLTPPTVTFPSTVSNLATTFPPSGNGQIPQIYAGKTGAVPFIATDPNPSGLNSSGVGCLRWGWDPQLAGSNWACGSNMPSGQIPGIIPGHWGTNILYVQAEDNAGNLSPIAPYSFYAPWNPNGPAPVFGDITGDSVPDIVAPDSAGNLRSYTVPGNPLAQAPATTLAAPQAKSPGADSWNNYLITHRGSLSGANHVDDLIAYKVGAKSLYYYQNPNNNSITGAFDTPNLLTKPACDPTLTDCTGYNATDWSSVKQIAASGDPSTTNLDPTKHFLNRTGLFTVETNPANDAALWFYPAIANAVFGSPVKLAATGWKNLQLISPGDWAGQGRPGLWARDTSTSNASGNITAYTFSTGTITVNVPFAGSVTLPTLTGIATSTQINSGVTTANWPTIGSDGDLTGNGHPTLWGITPSGDIQIWTGNTTGADTATPGYTFTTGPDTVLNTGAPNYEWKLASASPPLDVNGQNPLTASPSGAYQWEADHNGTPNAAASFHGASTPSYLQANIPTPDTTKSFSVSAWAKINSTYDNQTILCLAGNQRSPFYLQYSKSFGTWAFIAAGADDINTPTYYSASANTAPQVGAWTHLTATYNADTKAMTLYVGGQFAGSGTNPSPWKTTGPTIIGASAATGYSLSNALDGAVSDVQIYPYALTNQQVTNIYQNS